MEKPEKSFLKKFAWVIMIPTLGFSGAEFLSWRQVKANVEELSMEQAKDTKFRSNMKKLLCLLGRDITKEPEKLEALCKIEL